jgi:SAM-dependent MidA family methyltransferase
MKPATRDLRLPPPGHEAEAHSARVFARVVEAVDAAGGWLPFEDYMELVLYAPGLGYYSSGTTKFGAAGDFVTAPEISPLFGQTIAAELAPVVSATGWPLLELGGGSGRLARDVLEALADADALPPRYELLEVSATLRERQRETLAACSDEVAGRTCWLDTLPDGATGRIILANEVADALPVARLRKTGRALLPLGVTVENGRLAIRPGERDVAFEHAVRERLGTLPDAWPEAYETEIALGLPAWIQALLERQQAGFALFIDYGAGRAELYRPERRSGTLICHYRHRAHDDPLVWPGLQDLTAWVDFTTLGEAALDAGWAVAGYTTQAHFLLGGGITSLAAGGTGGLLGRLADADQIKRLTLPGEMGERFKVMGLARGLDVELPGFGFRDLMHLL